METLTQTGNVIYGLSNSAISDDLKQSSGSFCYCKAFYGRPME